MKHYLEHSLFVLQVMHSRFHGSLNPFVCPDCGATFTRKFELVNHGRLHGRLPHSCPVCNKEFLQKRTLVAHMRYDFYILHGVFIIMCTCDSYNSTKHSTLAATYHLIQYNRFIHTSNSVIKQKNILITLHIYCGLINNIVYKLLFNLYLQYIRILFTSFIIYYIIIFTLCTIVCSLLICAFIGQ